MLASLCLSFLHQKHAVSADLGHWKVALLLTDASVCGEQEPGRFVSCKEVSRQHPSMMTVEAARILRAGLAAPVLWPVSGLSTRAAWSIRSGS